MVAIRYVFPRWSFRHNFLSVARAQTTSGFLTKLTIESFDFSCNLLSGFLEFASLLRARQRYLAKCDRFRLLSNKFESRILILFYMLAEQNGSLNLGLAEIHNRLFAQLTEDLGYIRFNVLVREHAKDQPLTDVNAKVALSP